MAETSGRESGTWLALAQRHNSQGANRDRFNCQYARRRRADLPVAVAGHAQQQDESHYLAYGRSLEAESSETGEDDQAAGGETHSYYWPQRPGVVAARERVPEGESYEDSDSREHSCDGYEELVIHGILHSICRCWSPGPVLVGARDPGGAENGNPGRLMPPASDSVKGTTDGWNPGGSSHTARTIF